MNSPPSRPAHSAKPHPLILHRPPKSLARLVIGALLSFMLAIGLPFIVPLTLFSGIFINPEQSAPVVVDGRALFRVTNTATTASAAARAETISSRLQTFVQAEQQPKIEVSPGDSEGYATVWLGYPNLEVDETPFNFTVTAADTTSKLTPLEQAEEWAAILRKTFAQAQAQRQPDYIRRNLWKVVAIALLATLAHWLAAILWRSYLGPFLRSSMMESEPEPQRFTTLNLFLNLTLLILRTGIWVGALFYATDLFPVPRQFSRQALSLISESFTASNIPLGNRPISLVDIFRVFVMVLLVTIVARLIANVIKAKVLQETGINRGVQEAIAVLLRYSLMFIGALVVLQASGINLSSLTLLASALGVGAGLGLQNIVKDVGSGLVLVFERPVQVGEFIQIGNQTGTVERIGARSAEIRTLDQVSIIVPNSRFLENEVINWSHRNPISRIRIPVGVSYRCDPEQVREILLKTGRQHSDVLSSPPPQVLFTEFGESALRFDLLVWVAQPSRQFIIKSDLLFMLTKALRQANIEIPFPQRDIHLSWKDLPPTKE